MLSSAVPPKFPLVWAQDAGPTYVHQVPEASQIGITNGAASLADGFPPDCFTPTGAGGVPPFGIDTNGILQQLSQWSQWAAAGGPIFYDGAFSTAIGGYPQGAILTSSMVPGLLWRSTVNNNTTDPDSISATNWVPTSRIALLTATTFYVNASTGSDTTGTGMISAPWATLQKAFNTLQQQYDAQGNTITIQLADGTYTNPASLNGTIPGIGNPNNLIINGNSVTPSNVIYTAPISAQYAGACLATQNFKMSGSYGVTSSYGGTVQVNPGMVWGTMSGYHIYGNTRGNIIIAGNYTINGNAAAHISMLVGSLCAMNGGLTWNLSGSPSFGSFIIADGNSTVSAAAAGGSVYSGAVGGSGAPATVTATSLVYGTGGNNAYFPGVGNPILATLGQYL